MDNSYSILVIGGLIVNEKPLKLEELYNITNKVVFFDINQTIIDSNSQNISQQIYRQLLINHKNIIIMSYSTGGLIALQLANSYPQLIKKLIFINSSPCFMQKNNWNGISQEKYQNLYLNYQIKSVDEFNLYFCIMANHPQRTSYIKRKEIISKFISSKQIDSYLKFINSSDYTKLIQTINIKSLWLYADNDHIVPYNKIFNKNIKQHIITNSSHLTLNTQELYKQIKDFIYE